MIVQPADVPMLYYLTRGQPNWAGYPAMTHPHNIPGWDEKFGWRLASQTNTLQNQLL